MVKQFLKKVTEMIHKVFDKISLKMMNLTEKEHKILKKMAKEQEQKNNCSVSFIIVGFNVKLSFKAIGENVLL